MGYIAILYTMMLVTPWMLIWGYKGISWIDASHLWVCIKYNYSEVMCNFAPKTSIHFEDATEVFYTTIGIYLLHNM